MEQAIISQAPQLITGMCVCVCVCVAAGHV